jgi:DNA polymerase III subunit delta'
VWSNVIGQERIKHILRSALENERLPSAYLFHGPEGVGKDAAAIELAKAVNCLNPPPGGHEGCDECVHCQQMMQLSSPILHFVFALAKDVDTPGESNQKEEDLEVIREELAQKAVDPYYNIAIPRAMAVQVGQVRELRMNLSRSMGSGKKRIVIISEADMMNPQAQNAFLKTLEEPNPNTLIILTSSNINRFYPTILSRCQEVRFEVLSNEEITEALIERDELPRDEAEFIARLANGSYSQARRMIGEDLKEMRRQIVSFLRMGLSRSRKNALHEIDIFLPRSSAGSFLEKRQAVEQRLILLMLWLRDALAISTDSIEQIINIDQRDDLDRFVSRFGQPDKIIQAIRAVERAQMLTRQQVQLRPMMLDLVMGLESALVEAKV